MSPTDIGYVPYKPHTPLAIPLSSNSAVLIECLDLLDPPTFRCLLQVMLVNISEGSALIAGGGLQTVRISFLQGLCHNI